MINSKQEIFFTHKKILLSLLFISILLFSFSTDLINAQQIEIKFYSLDINFWPEYDNQNMLVRYKGVLDPNTPLPVKLKFKLPYNSTLMNYVTIENLSGQKIYLPYEVSQEGIYQVVEFTIDTLQFELTYHDQNFKKIVNQRFYNNDLVFDYEIYDLNIIFQEPQNSEDFQINPPPNENFTGMYNLNYQVVDYMNIEANQIIPIELNYFKDNDELTFNYIQPILPDTNTTNSDSNIMIIVTIGILLIIIFGLIIYLFKVENSEKINIRRNLKNHKKD